MHRLMRYSVSLFFMVCFTQSFAQSSTKSPLFVCTGNTGRSVMAEYIANNKFSFTAWSRGIKANPKELLPEGNAVMVLNEWHIAIPPTHLAKTVTADDIHRAPLVLALTKAHQAALVKLAYPDDVDKIKLLSTCADKNSSEDVLDAYGKEKAFYLATRDQIDSYINAYVNHGYQCDD